MTTEQHRVAYLTAMGIDVWRARGAAEAVDAIRELSGELTAEVSEQGRQVENNDDSETTLLDWQRLQEKVKSCTRCDLHRTRTQTVFGVGNPHADWLIVGEAPGQQEDQRGEPFVGRAGKLLDQMLLAVGLDRSSVFIANVLKCRPPNNRDPSKEEAASCSRFLRRQIELIEPRIVLAVGRIAAQLLLASDAPLGRLRGQRHFLQDGTLPLVVTYHPAYLLRSPSQKAKAWQDLCLAKQIVAESISQERTETSHA